MVFPIVTVSLNLGGGESSSPCLKFKVNVCSSPKSAVTGLQTTKIENRQQREQHESGMGCHQIDSGSRLLLSALCEVLGEVKIQNRILKTNPNLKSES
jgi:hypothetical protein